MYFDKITPREFGKAESWNFLCKRESRIDATESNDDERQDPSLVKIGNFEKVTEY